MHFNPRNPNFTPVRFLGAVFQLLRPVNLLLGVMTVIIAATLLTALPDWQVIVKAMTVVLLFTAGANALNDYFDYRIDRINRPARPLAAGLLPRWFGLIFAGVLFGGGVLVAMTMTPLAYRLGVYVALPLLILYTPLFKSLPLAGNLVVAAVLALTFLFAGAAFGRLVEMWIPALLAFGFTLVREMIKDVEDVTGDEQNGLRTLPVRMGVPLSVKLVQLLTLFLMIGCLLPYILGYYGMYYLLALLVGVEFPLAWILYHLQNNPTPAGSALAAKVLKLNIFTGLLAIYLSRFDG